MSQSSAILTLHRRTGGDTEGGRAIARQTPRARGARRLLRRKRGVTARASRPGPASKLPSLGRRGLAEALRAPRGGGGACLFLKSGSACRRPEPGRRPKAAARGGRGTADVGARACTRRGAARPGGGGPGTPGCAQAVAAGRAGCSSAGAAGSGGAGLRGARRVNFCGLGGQGGVCVCTCVRRSAARTAGPQLRVPRQPAVFVQLRSSRAAPAHPGAAPAGKPSRTAWPAALAAAAAAATRKYGCSSAGEKRGVWGGRLA
ncbi:PREDICTED: uncharacterized protein LOC101364681 [Odobenus rosmarus divergens]|uniref:Uncharacterized protein LOC101364681 n=1 Tax=Odobenus rosmarus divergens TaxID=9708 RepID=A0A9B0GHX8_ODORO